MGFLSGVLSNIKEHLGHHKETISEAINILNKNKNRGKKGFNEAIGEVVAGVGRYNDAVMKSNKKVSEPMTLILSQVNDKFKKTVADILPEKTLTTVKDFQVSNAVEQIDKLLQQCQKHANKVNADLNIDNSDGTIKNAINDLNNDLSLRVKNSIKSVKYETDRMRRMADSRKRELQQTTAKIKAVFSNVENCINDKVRDDIDKLVKGLKLRVQKILEQLRYINKEVEKYVKQLGECMKKAESYVNVALENVNKVLAESNEKDSSTKAYKIRSIVEQLEAAVLVLHSAGDDARQRVQTEVTAALAAVKTMNDDLKKDLYSVKNKIKEAVQQLGRKLDENVRDGLWAIEDTVTEKLNPIAADATEFLKHFSLTQGALDRAMGAVATDLANFKDLSRIGRIADVLGFVPLLTEIRKSKPFEKLTQYFDDLDKKIMQGVKKVMEKIGEGISKRGVFPRSAGTETIFDRQLLFKELNSLHSAVSITVAKIRDVTIDGLNFSDATKLDLQNKLSRCVSAINAVTTKLKGVPSGDQISQDEAKSLLIALGAIAEAVSSHSAEVVKAAMEHIKTNVENEIRCVAGIIDFKVGECRQLINDHTGNLVGPVANKPKGLEALVKNFDRQIKQSLTGLQSTVNEKFKRTNSRARDKENYEFGLELMNDFNTTNADLINGELKQNQRNVLDEHIGRDIPASSGDRNKISEFSNTFTKYGKQVARDSVAAAEKDPNALTGTLPAAIKEIRDDVTNALTSIDEYNRYANEDIGNVKSTLSELCKVLKDEASNAKWNLDTIKTKTIKGQLEYVKTKLNDLRLIDLGAAIKETENFLSSASPTAQVTITSIRGVVSSNVEEAQNTLITQVNKNYVMSVQDMMRAFATKVTEDLGPLPEQIKKDLEKGHKKFMKLFADKFVAYINEIKSLTATSFTPKGSRKLSPVSQAAKELNKALSFFFLSLKRQPDITGDVDLAEPAKNAVIAVLGSIQTSNHFDHTFVDNLVSLENTMHEFNPITYGEGNNPWLLDSLKNGFTTLATELNRAYVSRYAGQQHDGALLEIKVPATLQPQRTDVSEVKEELTDYGRRCARVCLTIVPTLVAALTHLKNVLESNNGKRKNYKIYDLKGSSHSLRTLFFGDNGYDVGLPDDADYGELNHRDDCSGGRILKHLTEGEQALLASSDAASTLNPRQSLDGPTVDVDNEDGVISKLHNYLGKYFKVRHFTHIPKSKSPCNVYEMLQWLSGLQFNGVFSALASHIHSVFLVEDKEHPTQKIVKPMNAYPKKFTRENIWSTIEHLSERAYYLLTGLLGHGDAECGYACEFSDNSLQLKYPTSGADCFSTLLDILRRLFPALQFLERRCSDASTDFGWGDCLYGKGIHTSNTLCNEHSTNEVTCQANCQANSRPNCQPTSPLMSYLNDCLPGHLPHQLIDVGCQSTCKTCPNNLPGQPCITPLGFRGFSSSVKTGRDLREIIHEFFDHEHLPALFCLMAKPPSTLPEHFEFALSLVSGWTNPTMSHRSGIKQAIESSIGNQSIDLYKNPGDLTDALTRCYGADCSNCEHSHITSLTSSGYCSRGGKDIPCSPYLSSLCSNTYLYLAEKHSNAYLSWAIYLPWNFHTYLEMFLQAFSDIFCGDWGCRSCLKSANCKRGKHGHSDKDQKTETDTPYCRCTSVVTCKGVAPTLYSYGFSFANTWALNEEETRKTCTNFYDGLKAIVKSQYFTDLFNECDVFLWRIREPFTYLVLALWSLSLFYLLCVMVGRLDVLHIRSHVRIPSSHKITAQSLLAAAQVGRLAKISYLQP